MQDLAQLIQGVGIDVGIFPQSVQLTGADMIFLDQLILGDTPLF